MQNIKNKMYDYEVAPPSECWKKINTSLNNEKFNYSALPKMGKSLYYKMAVAASLAVIIFSLIFWLNKHDSNKNEIAGSENINKNAGGNNNYEDKITVPKITSDVENNAGTAELKNNKKPSEKSLLEANNKYITIAGPQGQAVKISSKAAALIVSSDDQNPPKPVWSDKVKKWKEIMKTNTLAATTADFLDIVELTHALTMNNP